MLTGSPLVNLQYEEQKPLRFTDSPQHHPSNVTPNPSPRRKSSSTSNEGMCMDPAYNTPYYRGTTIYIPGDYHGMYQ